MDLSAKLHKRYLIARCSGALAVVLFLALVPVVLLKAEELSFEDAWQRVQLNNDGLAAQRANVDRSKLLQEAAQSLYLPQIELTGTYTQLDDPVQLDALDLNPLAALRGTPLGEGIVEAVGGEEAFTTDLTDDSFGRVALTALWPVYTGGRITAAQDVSAAQSRVAESLLDTRTRLAFEVLVEAYFGVVLARQNLATRNEVLEGLAQHLQNAMELEEQGQIAKVERLSVAAAHDRAGVGVTRAQQELEIAEISLRQILHSQVQVNPIDPLFTNIGLPADSEFMRAALDSSPALKALQAQDAEAAALLKAERGRYHPEVFLFADYEVYQDDSIALELVPEWQVGIGVNIALLDRLGRNKSIVATQKGRDVISRFEDETRRELQVATQVLHRQAYLALAEFSGLGSSLALAEENLHLRTEAFSQGLSTSVEVVDAQLAIAAVQTEMSAAAFHYVVSLARLLALSGQTQEFARYQRESATQTRIIRSSDE